MNFHLWPAFVAASAVMGLAPGPAVTSIVGNALSSGRATALAAVAGVALGNVIARPSAAAWMQRAGGGVLIAAGAATAVSRT